MNTRIVGADHLRRYTQIKKIETEKQRKLSQDADQTALDEQRRVFMEGKFEESELLTLLDRVTAAARAGAFEYEVMDFPAAFCTDGGRAINNADPAWPGTLQGKAKNFHTIWKEHGKPQGYRLKVKVISYPRGFIGDISLLVDWS